jgi:hypothetical protein
VGAVALVLAGAATGHADAMRRYQAVNYANNSIDQCFAAGGDASVYEFPGSFNIVCIFEDGGDVTWEVSYDE